MTDDDQQKARPVRNFKKGEGPREREESTDSRKNLDVRGDERHLLVRC